MLEERADRQRELGLPGKTGDDLHRDVLWRGAGQVDSITWSSSPADRNGPCGFGRPSRCPRWTGSGTTSNHLAIRRALGIFPHTGQSASDKLGGKGYLKPTGCRRLSPVKQRHFDIPTAHFPNVSSRVRCRDLFLVAECGALDFQTDADRWLKVL